MMCAGYIREHLLIKALTAVYDHGSGAVDRIAHDISLHAGAAVAVADPAPVK